MPAQDDGLPSHAHRCIQQRHIVENFASTTNTIKHIRLKGFRGSAPVQVGSVHPHHTCTGMQGQHAHLHTCVSWLDTTFPAKSQIKVSEGAIITMQFWASAWHKEGLSPLVNSLALLLGPACPSSTVPGGCTPLGLASFGFLCTFTLDAPAQAHHIKCATSSTCWQARWPAP